MSLAILPEPTVAREPTGRWAVMVGNEVVSVHDTNAQAWRAVDRLNREPHNRSENTGDWVASQILNSWPE